MHPDRSVPRGKGGVHFGAICDVLSPDGRTGSGLVPADEIGLQIDDIAAAPRRVYGACFFAQL